MTEDSSNQKQTIFFQNTILDWFKENGRKYPWRIEKDPYKILIAEIMLQRTRVGQVLPVYKEFIKKFPDVQSVADSEEKDISFFISKLGLFWRSKLIKETAKNIIHEYKGKVPADRKELLKIPGIGDYIADAMISFAFNGKRIVIDSNVIRLVTRFFGIESTGEMRRNKKFIDFCQNLSNTLDSKNIHNFNWALIDHSAAICKPTPVCKKCPLSENCDYFKERGLIVKRQ
jgi:A/G-specific adenine glycosylase